MYRSVLFRQIRRLHGSRILTSEAKQFSGKLNDNNPEECDVAIVGGGMVGLALASALSNLPLTKQLRVAIVDSNPFLGSKGYLKKDEIPDSRVSTVTPATISFFKEIGAWDHVIQQRHAFFDRMQVWDYTGLGYTRYNAKDVRKEYLGCVVENKVLCNSLLSSFQNKEGFENMIYPTKMASMNLPSKGNSVKLQLTNDQTLLTKLVVGADGSKSLVRETAGIETSGWSYPQTAIICTVKHSSQNTCAWQRFLPGGPIALLPVGDHFSNIVWTMPAADSARHLSMDQPRLAEAINRALSDGPHPKSGLGDCFEKPPVVLEVVSERLGFGLGLKHAKEYVKSGVVLVGDSAHTVHPLAGQGVNLGFGDAEALARVLSHGVQVGAQINEMNMLRKYERERKAVNIAMMAVLESIQKAYSFDFGPLNVLRAAAFHGAQYITPLKKNIISYAVGDMKFPLFS